MFGQKINIQTTSTGHYYVNVMRNDKESNYNENVILLVDSNMERSDKRNALLKLHKQFGHASQEKLLNLLKTAGMVYSIKKLDIFSRIFTRNVQFVTNTHILYETNS